MYEYKMEDLYQLTVERLNQRGVELSDIGEIVYSLQKKYIPHLTMEECLDSVEAVLHKREVVHSILTGLAIDAAVQAGQFPEPIQSIIAKDEGLYGIDEILPLGIVNIYGTIGLTNFGFLDKEKTGIIKKLDESDVVTTFIDDIIGAVAAAAASRISHAQAD